MPRIKAYVVIETVLDRVKSVRVFRKDLLGHKEAKQEFRALCAEHGVNEKQILRGWRRRYIRETATCASGCWSVEVHESED